MKQKPTEIVRKNCANYNAGFICTGAMINRQGKMWLEESMANKPCLIKEGKECQYYKNVVEVK